MFFCFRVTLQSPLMDVLDRGAAGTTRNGRSIPAPVHQPPRTSPNRSPVRTQPTNTNSSWRSLSQGITSLRLSNDYVDTPTVGHGRQVQVPHTQTINGLNREADRSRHRAPVLTQPQPTIKKDGGSSGSTNSTTADEQHVEACTDSIICPQCNKCRCDSCTQPRPLPSRWLCDNKFECSFPRGVECISCVCCVRAVFYYCCWDSEGEEGGSVSDDPCACCERPHCCKRWTCLGAFTLCLPCLCLYWPLRGLQAMCTSCYNRCQQRGCTCRRNHLPGSSRLLIDSESSSAWSLM